MSVLSRFSSTAAPRKPMLSIRARLVILALLAVVPLMLDRVRLMEASRTERIEHAATEVLDLAKRGADRQREIMTTVRAMLQVMARAYVTMRARGDTCNFYLTDLAANMPWIKGMSIVGPRGASPAPRCRRRSASICRIGGTIARRSRPATSSSAAI